jgi:hypothetical protein
MKRFSFVFTLVFVVSLGLFAQENVTADGEKPAGRTPPMPRVGLTVGGMGVTRGGSVIPTAVDFAVDAVFQARSGGYLILRVGNADNSGILGTGETIVAKRFALTDVTAGLGYARTFDGFRTYVDAGCGPGIIVATVGSGTRLEGHADLGFEWLVGKAAFGAKLETEATAARYNPLVLFGGGLTLSIKP